MSEQQALAKLETMSEAEFQEFFKSLPARVQLLIRGGMANWREVLPEWYINQASV